jgi:hypothetical protein
MTRFGKNLMSLSFEVILALLGLGLSAWYLTETSIAYDVSKCSDKVETDPVCKQGAVQITILAIMLALSIGMLAWGVSC